MTALLQGQSSSYRASKRNPCPVCGKDHGCRVLENGLVMCLREERDTPGWRHIKPLGNGMGGLFSPSTEERGSDWHPRALHQRIQTLTKPLSIDARDRQYRAVLGQLDLSEGHQQKLIERGLAKEESDQAGLVSWIPGTKVGGGSMQLPGIDQRGERLVGCRGIFIPAKDPSGRITGGQVWTDSGRPGKYVWVSSAKQDDPTRPGPQMPEGSLPLPCWVHPEAQQISTVLVCEGFLKSLVTATYLWRKGRFDVAVIGNGGISSVDSTLFQEYLKTLGQRCDGSLRVILCPDAGAIQNINVARPSHRYLKWLQAWGYNPEVAWWQQVQKRDPDIDDLFVAGKSGRMKLISPQAFFDLHPIKIREQLEAHTIQRRGLTRSEYPVVDPHPEPTPDQVIRYNPISRPNFWLHFLGRSEAAKVNDEGWPCPDRGIPLLAIDQSGTGSGKSHAAGLLRPELFHRDSRPITQLVYVTSDPRNVTTETLRDWETLEGRHGGLMLMEGPGGSHQVRRGEGSYQGPNCARHELAALLPAKNVPSTGEHICPGCPCRKSCAAGEGDYRYLGERKHVLSSDRIVAHPSSLDPQLLGESLLIVDEWASINPVKTFTASPSDIDRTLLDLSDNLQPLAPLLHKLRGLLQGTLPRYGIPHTELLAQLGEVPTVDPDAIAAFADQSLTWLADPETEEGTSLSDLPRELRRRFRPTDEQMEQEAQNRIRLNWLEEFWDALNGGRTHIRLTSQGLSISTIHQHHLDVLHSASAVLVLDATTDAGEIKQWVGNPNASVIAAADPVEVRRKLAEGIATCDPRLKESRIQMLQLMGDPQPGASLSIKQVLGLGLLTSSRGKRQQHRARAIIEAIKAKDPSAQVIDWQAHSRDGEGYWFRDSRGSNAFQEAKTLILVGSPFVSMAAAEAEYHLLTGQPATAATTLRSYTIRDAKQPPGGPWWISTLTEAADPKFAAWYRGRVVQEIHQALGRLRASRRSGERLTVYLLGDYPLPFDVEVVQPGDISPDAMTMADRITAAIKQLDKQGIPATQSQIAAMVGIDQANVSRIIADLSNPLPEPDPGWFVNMQNAIERVADRITTNHLESLTPQAFEGSGYLDPPKPDIGGTTSEETSQIQSSTPPPEIEPAPPIPEPAAPDPVVYSKPVDPSVAELARGCRELMASLWAKNWVYG